MSPITVLLGFGPKLLLESLAALLRSQPSEDRWFVPQISEATDLVELLDEIQQTQAEVVIVTGATKADSNGIRSHIFSAFPHVSVMVLSADDNSARHYRQAVVVEQIAALSLERLLATLGQTELYWSSPGTRWG